MKDFNSIFGNINNNPTHYTLIKERYKQAMKRAEELPEEKRQEYYASQFLSIGGSFK